MPIEKRSKQEMCALPLDLWRAAPLRHRRKSGAAPPTCAAASRRINGAPPVGLWPQFLRGRPSNSFGVVHFLAFGLIFSVYSPFSLSVCGSYGATCRASGMHHRGSNFD